ncbi:MAG: hypothetical protein GY950_23630 [bacterium]|nr:hypothetical protein [bacterium]
MTEAGYTLFFFAHTVVFFFMSYRPTRYFIPVIPAMVFMTVLLFKQFTLSRQDERPRIRPVSEGVLYVLDVLWLTAASAFCLLPLVSRYIYTIHVPQLSIKYLLICAALTALFYLIKNVYHKLVWKKPDFRFVYIPLAILMVAASIYINMNYYLQWNRDKTFAVRDISVELGEKLDNAYIGGMTAPVAVLENRHKALWLFPNFVNWDEKTFEKYPLTHALLGTDISREINLYFSTWPDRMAGAILLKVFHIKDYFLHLYSFVDPYIREGKSEDNTNFQLIVVNPSPGLIKTRIGKIYISEEGPGRQSFNIKKGQQEFELKPGDNTITMSIKEMPSPKPPSILFFLEYPHRFSKKKLRYEGENFPRKTGSNKKVPSASNRNLRYYNSSVHTPGFLSYGPSVPYAGGVLMADFKLKFDNLKSKIRPLARVDIFSYQDDGPVAERFIKPADIKKNKEELYRVSAVIPAVKRLEFRLQATKYADISFDYIDVTYYQGIFINTR